MTPDTESNRESGHSLLLNEFTAYFSEHTVENLYADLAAIRTRANVYDIDPQSASKVAERLTRAIRDRQPFALIRIGDGEGNILALRRQDYPALVRFGRDRILEMMYGSSAMADDDLGRIVEDLENSILEADIIGISDENRLSRMSRFIRTIEDTPDFRGFIGSAESMHAVRNLLDQRPEPVEMVTSNHIHRYLGPHYRSILSDLDFIGYVGPYAIDALLQEAFRPGSVEGHLIPNQHLTAPETGRAWYPDTYQQLLSTLRIPFRGAVYIVAAGILGEALCVEIKRRGGIAIDVGSMMDVWTGRGVRQYQTDDFVAANRL